MLTKVAREKLALPLPLLGTMRFRCEATLSEAGQAACPPSAAWLGSQAGRRLLQCGALCSARQVVSLSSLSPSQNECFGLQHETERNRSSSGTHSTLPWEIISYFVLKISIFQIQQTALHGRHTLVLDSDVFWFHHVLLALGSRLAAEVHSPEAAVVTHQASAPLSCVS